MVDVKADYLFEVSWEVCNKVGGIYTVVSSKAALVNEKYKNYFLIGPYFENKVKMIFIEEKPPELFNQMFEELKKEGIVCHYGKWDIKGEPNVILIDSKGYTHKKDEIKNDLWNHFKVDSMWAQWDFEEPMIWATAVGRLIQRFAELNPVKIVSQFHEWLAGFGLLYLKKNNCKVSTVFTTHATMLGRTIAGSGGELYDRLAEINPEEEASKSKIQDKFTTEKACAQKCEVFTTVSEITAMEAEKFLGRKPDVLVLNGLDIEKFPTFEETSIEHQRKRERAREFIRYYFFPHYYFDVEESLFFFIVGRYEYKNKGIDIMIDALMKLNDKMKAENSKKTVIAFFWIPRSVHGTKKVLIENKSYYDDVKEFVHRNRENIQQKIVDNIMGCHEEEGKAICDDDISHDLFNKSFIKQTQKLKSVFIRTENPLVVTHDLPNEGNDTIVQNFIQKGLDNKEDDKVKVIFYPIYLTGADGLLDLAYYDAIMACHLGLFPSYYEPWGYTPLETAALGVPALTTDYGGFGRFLLSKGHSESGIYVLKRFGKTYEQLIEEFGEMLFKFTKLNRQGRVKQKMIAKELSTLADWKTLVDNYYIAQNLAIDKVFG